MLRPRLGPVFAAAVMEQTLVRALFALPLQCGGVNLGVLDLYRATPGLLPAGQWADAMAAADAAAIMLLRHRTDRDGPVADGFEGRLQHVDSGHAATGMVLAQLGISAADALARMRACSFVHQRLLIDVSRDVLDHSLVFSDEPT